jgi:hypothetical protein
VATLTLTAGTHGAMPNKALRIDLKSLRPGQSGIFKGKLTEAMPPLRPKHVWSIRTKLQIEGRTRDLAMFNLAIDSKLRGCDVVAIRVEDVAAGGSTERTDAGLALSSAGDGGKKARSPGSTK